MADLGSDFSCVTDVDANLSVVSGRACLVQAIARRWIALPGSLFYDPHYGAGLVGYINGSDQDIDRLAAKLENEALKDERVSDCTVSVSYANGTLKVAGVISDADGPFNLTVSVSALTVTVLAENT